MIDFVSVDFLPYHVFPTTLDPNNFGIGWIHILRNGKQWHFYCQCSIKGGNENIIKNFISRTLNC